MIIDEPRILYRKVSKKSCIKKKKTKEPFCCDNKDNN